MTLASRPPHQRQPSRPHAAETAGRLAVASYPAAVGSESVRAVRERLAAGTFGAADLLVVTSADGRYAGAVPLVRLLQADSDAQVAALMQPGWPTVAAEVDQERAVHIAAEANVATLPVVAADGTVVGVLPPVVLLEVMAREHREDLHRLVGVLRERDGSRHALEDHPLRRAARRLPWLLVGLALSAAATAVMHEYESTMQANLAIAVFIPAIVYLTDAIGTQTEAIAVRGLSLRRLPLARILALELATGALIGLVIGAAALPAVWLMYGSLPLAVGVSATLLIAGTLASSIGLVLPWLLAKTGIDPAFGSGPVATIIQDVLTILVYFTVMAALMGAPA